MSETGIKELILFGFDIVTGIAIVIGDRKGGAIRLQPQLTLKMLYRMLIFYLLVSQLGHLPPSTGVI